MPSKPDRPPGRGSPTSRGKEVGTDALAALVSHLPVLTTGRFRFDCRSRGQDHTYPHVTPTWSVGPLAGGSMPYERAKP